MLSVGPPGRNARQATTLPIRKKFDTTMLNRDPSPQPIQQAVDCPHGLTWLRAPSMRLSLAAEGSGRRCGSAGRAGSQTALDRAQEYLLEPDGEPRCVITIEMGRWWFRPSQNLWVEHQNLTKCRLTGPCRVLTMNTVYIQGRVMNEVGLRIRVDDALRRDFIETCKLQDTTAAQILRAFMRSYVEQYGRDLRQGSLFDQSPKRRRPHPGSGDN